MIITNVLIKYRGRQQKHGKSVMLVLESAWELGLHLWTAPDAVHALWRVKSVRRVRNLCARNRAAATSIAPRAF